jgi:hypothetical protein
MSNFIRPEAQQWLTRWGEVLFALGFTAFSLWLGSKNYGILGMLGWVFVPMGLVWAFLGWRRVRFGRAGRGPGVVIVDEGEVSYFGPLDGGAVQASEMARLVLDPSARPAHWVLEQSGVAPLHIPVNADGAEALFDVFAGLPGIHTERMLNELNGPPKHPVVIWERTPSNIARNRLH